MLTNLQCKKSKTVSFYKKEIHLREEMFLQCAGAFTVCVVCSWADADKLSFSSD
jgi:hypothetical protein